MVARCCYGVAMALLGGCYGVAMVVAMLLCVLARWLLWCC